MILVVICVTTTQSLFKWRMGQNRQSANFIGKIKLYFSDFWLMLAVGLIVLKFVFWSLAIRDLSLGYCAMFVSLTNLTILFSGRFFFKEKITRNKIVALVLILSGVTLINL